MFSLSRGQAALRGILVAGLGAVLIAWPAITIGTVIALIAAYLAFDAGVAVVAAFRHGVSGRDRALLLVRSLIQVVAAVVAVAYPGATASIIAVIVGIYAIAVSGLELAVTGRLYQAGARGLGWKLTGGIVGVMTGIALVVWPGIGAVTLALVFGGYLVVAGVTLVLASFAAPVPAEA
jgi:uncharacterized membrane protein HdeD (DUF308 family)